MKDRLLFEEAVTTIVVLSSSFPLSGQELAPFCKRWLPRFHRACSLHLSG
jgi:hypothetical protein